MAEPAVAQRQQEVSPGHALEEAGGWAGDVVAQDGTAWVAFATCDDPEIGLLTRADRTWALRPDVTVEHWRECAREASFAVHLARLDVRAGEASKLAAVRELGRSRHAFEGPALAAMAGHDAPVVVWAERSSAGSVLLASVVGGPAEVVCESGGAILGPRVAADGSGRVWAAWQQWPDGGAGSDAGPVDGAGPTAEAGTASGPHILVAMRSAAGVWSQPITVSQASMSAWAPSLAADRAGGVWCAWDAWDGATYHVYVSHARPAGAWSAPARISGASRRGLNMAPDVAAMDGGAWVVWNRSSPWGTLNHRFNHERSLHAAVVRVSAGGELTAEPAPGLPVVEERGRLPVPSTPFLHSTEHEAVNPQAPLVRAGPDGPVVFFRQFRSANFKDFGWRVGAIRHTGADWSAPELIGAQSGFADTPYGAALLDAPGDGGTPWLLAYHGGDYPRDPNAHPSRPVAGHRLVIETERLERATSSSSGQEAARSNGAVLQYEPPPVAKVAAPTRTISNAGQRYTLLWGDLHRHSAYSKCMSANDGDPLDHWRWVHDVAPLDFYALTEHLEYMSYVEWRRIDDLAQRLAGSGVLALCGFEFSNEPGHTNFFYADEAIATDLRVACLAVAEGGIQEVWPRLDVWGLADKVVAIRHHQGHRGDLRDGTLLEATYGSRYEPVVEAIQTRGEYKEWVQSLWRRGFRVGVIGGSDHSRAAPFVQALTGMWLAPQDRTREGLLDGLRARRTFATNGVRLSVYLSATPASSAGTTGTAGDAAPVGMGEAGTIAGPVRLTVRAHGTRPLDTIEFYRDDRLLHVAQVIQERQEQATVEYVDGDAVAGARSSGGEVAYWVRVTQEGERNGARPHKGIAYSSPVWVSAV